MFMIIYYTILLGLFFYISNVFDLLTYELINATFSRIIRDVAILYSIVQIPFLAIVFVRMVGFNLKKFSFESDFKDLDLSYKDEEEVEVGLNLNSYKFKRKIRKDLREFKYYLVENKFVVIIVCIILLGIAGFMIYNSISPSYDRRYKMNSSFTYGNFDINIEDALFTKMDYKGDVIRNDKYYVVLRTKVTNRLQSANTFDVNALKLKTRSGTVSPTESVAEYFVDFAKTDNSSYIMAKESVELAVCYEIDLKDIDSSYQVIISNGTATFNGQIYNKSIYVRIDVEDNNAQKTNKYLLDDDVSFEEFFLKGNSLKINNYNLSKSFKYTYDSCANNKCTKLINIVNVSAFNNRHDNYLLTITGTYQNNNNSSRYNSLNSIISHFGKIEYTKDDTIYYANLINVTPNTYKDGVILEVPNDVYYASKIDLVISTRFNRYVINLK